MSLKESGNKAFAHFAGGGGMWIAAAVVHSPWILYKVLQKKLYLQGIVIMGADDDVFVPEVPVFARKHGDDVMGCPLDVFTVREVLVIPNFLLSFDNGFKPQAAELSDKILRVPWPGICLPVPEKPDIPPPAAFPPGSAHILVQLLQKPRR